MRSCLLKKILPFALCFAVGASLAGVGKPSRQRKSGAPCGAATAQARSRTWLVIRERPPAEFPKEVYESAAQGSVVLRLRLGADGGASEIVPVSVTLPESCVAPAIAAAKRIRFSPATQDGVPLDAVVEVEYVMGVICGDGFDARGRRVGGCYGVPSSPTVRLVSVEGAGESEGWRVVYE